MQTISVRLSDEDAALLDQRRGDTPKSDYLRSLLHGTPDEPEDAITFSRPLLLRSFRYQCGDQDQEEFFDRMLMLEQLYTLGHLVSYTRAANDGEEPFQSHMPSRVRLMEDGEPRRTYYAEDESPNNGSGPRRTFVAEDDTNEIP